MTLPRTQDKSNEITAIPLLLDILDIKGCIVTIDAMGCQTAIVEKIVEKEADYVITCKGNQGHLHADIETLFAQLFQETNELTDLTYHQSVDQQHGRREVREYWSTAQLASLRGKERWSGLQSVAMVRSQRQTSKGIATETRYLISSLPNDAARLLARYARIGRSRISCTGFYSDRKLVCSAHADIRQSDNSMKME